MQLKINICVQTVAERRFLSHSGLPSKYFLFDLDLLSMASLNHRRRPNMRKLRP